MLQIYEEEEKSPNRSIFSPINRVCFPRVLQVVDTTLLQTFQNYFPLFILINIMRFSDNCSIVFIACFFPRVFVNVLNIEQVQQLVLLCRFCCIIRTENIHDILCFCGAKLCESSRISAIRSVAMIILLAKTNGKKSFV